MPDAFDPRITPARPDIAASHLRGVVEAARFVDGAVHVVTEAQAPLRRAPRPDAPLDSEALRGERVVVYETTDEGWAWGQLVTDDYVGWIPLSALGQYTTPETHIVRALRTFVFPGPSIKLVPSASPPFGARLTVARMEGTFAHLAGGGLVPAIHLAGLGTAEPDYVATAERFVGTPYLWGGRTSAGVDCSGLVQTAVLAAGLRCPRDSDMQERSLGRELGPAAPLRRGDLVFWPGHVGLLRDQETLLHANAHHMAVASEPLADAVARIRQAGTEISSIKRVEIEADPAQARAQ